MPGSLRHTPGSAPVAALILAASLGVVSSARATPAPTASPLPPAFREFQQGPDGGTVWQGRIPNGYVRRATRPTIVYLPPGFSTRSRYPVVYLLQGFRGSPYQYVSGLRLPAVADHLIAARKVAPFIAVIPPAGVTAQYNGEWTGVWEQYLVHDVVVWSERHLPISTVTRRRALAGLSGGGYGAIDIGLRHVGLFGTLESWSGSFAAPRDGSLAHATAAQLAAHDPGLLARLDAPRLRARGMRVFLSAGTHDRAALRATVAFAGELSSLRIEHRLWLGSGGHDGSFWASQLAPALEYAVSPPTDL